MWFFKFIFLKRNTYTSSGSYLIFCLSRPPMTPHQWRRSGNVLLYYCHMGVHPDSSLGLYWTLGSRRAPHYGWEGVRVQAPHEVTADTTGAGSPSYYYNIMKFPASHSAHSDTTLAERNASLSLSVVEVLVPHMVFTDNLGQRMEWTHYCQVVRKILTPHYLAFSTPPRVEGKRSKLY